MRPSVTDTRSTVCLSALPFVSPFYSFLFTPNVRRSRRGGEPVRRKGPRTIIPHERQEEEQAEEEHESKRVHFFLTLVIHFIGYLKEQKDP